MAYKDSWPVSLVGLRSSRVGRDATETGGAGVRFRATLM
jgi:hypothetical protein